MRQALVPVQGGLLEARLGLRDWYLHPSAWHHQDACGLRLMRLAAAVTFYRVLGSAGRVLGFAEGYRGPYAHVCKKVVLETAISTSILSWASVTYRPTGYHIMILELLS